MPPNPNPFRPVVRMAPLGQLNAYPVYEYELDALAQGSSGSLLLNISFGLIPFAGAFIIAIFGTDIPSPRVYVAFVVTAWVTGLAGLICLALGWRSFRSNQTLVAEIKRRMPPPATPAP